MLLAVTPWGAMTFMWSAMGTAFLFSLKKFVENPAGLTLILTLPSYISIFLGPVCNFLSDRIWTRIGRRKPFIIVAWAGAMVALILMPFAPNLGCLIGAYLLFGMSLDIGSPLEALKQEIIPPHQRGRATAAMQWMQNGAGLIFAFVALGRFDDVRYMGGHLFAGETLIYWSAALLVLVIFFLLVFGIKEIDPKSPLVGQKISVTTFFKAILDRDLWPVYTLIFGAAMLNAGLGPLGNLLYTDQWNYTKQDMGTNVAIGGVINLFVIGFLALIADRLDRMKAYQFLIVTSMAVQAGYFLYVEFVLPDRRPSLVEIIFFGETLSILGVLTSMVYIPLVYDYITRDKMGTYGAGASLLNRLTSILTLNAIGLFIWGYAVLFQPPAGDMVRISLNGEFSSREVRSIVNSQSWRIPDGNPAPVSSVYVQPWYSTGVVRDKGSSWEVRLRDHTSEALASRSENQQDEVTALLAKEKMLRDQATADLGQHNLAEQQEALKQADAKRILIDQGNGEISLLEHQLSTRENAFSGQVIHAFADKLLPDGGQITGADIKNALVIELATNERPTAALEKTLVELRRANSHVIDLAPIKLGTGYGVAVSAQLDANVSEESLTSELPDTLVRLSSRREPGLFVSPPRVLKREHRPVLVLHLKVTDSPLDDHVSPITWLVNSVLGWFDGAPQPEKRLSAMARSLRSSNAVEHVGVRVEPGDMKTITVSALLLPQSPLSAVNDSITKRLQKLLGIPVPGIDLPQVRAFYNRVVDAGIAQNIIVERPVFLAAYAPMKYDYMCGYIGLFFLGLIGLAITFAFVRREKMGLIRKRGVEEAEGLPIT